MPLSIKVIKTAGSYTLCAQTVLDKGAFLRAVGYSVLDNKAELIGNFATQAEGLAMLSRLALPWRGVMPSSRAFADGSACASLSPPIVNRRRVGANPRQLWCADQRIRTAL